MALLYAHIYIYIYRRFFNPKMTYWPNLLFTCFYFYCCESIEYESSSFSFLTAGKPNIDPFPPGGSLGKNKGRNLWITIPHSGSVDHLNDELNHSKYQPIRARSRETI